MSAVLAAIFGGLIGGIVGPIVLEEYRNRKHAKTWKEPRKKLLESMLRDTKYKFKTLERLSRTIGCTEDQTRSLLIELEARGAVSKKTKKEIWALIERAPLQESQRKLDEEEIEEEQE
ncbi:hypothetical protein I5192_16560 [Ruegeria sp. SCSIO 43209]|jgi:hypothetical protein|uniref:hypothetical protein n=1 Tax=Ruegeria sp. SCSIO 43209 TaxID=2793010 RepID=UPI00147B5CF8|nr:hypothetical protein [Ruegeria sp. SCSIO 43209]UAB88811.1 hypothetical protein I5192_16560 [Ruegeria sp. SCSIO 43209]